MTDVATALYEFWSGFGIPAFVENTIPDEMPDGTPVKMPYITYRLAEPDWINPISMYARVWYRGTSFTWLSAKVDEIGREIGTGKTIPFENGCLTLFKDDIFSQYMSESDDGMVKTAYLSLIMHSIKE